MDDQPVFKADEAAGSILIPKIDTEKLEKQKKDLKAVFKSKWVKLLILASGVLAIFVLVFGILSFRVYKKALVVKSSVERLQAVGARKDLSEIENELVLLRQSTLDLKSSFRPLAIFRFVPWVGLYLTDVEHFLNAGIYGLEAGDIVLSSVKPYADIIGFAGGQESESPEETTKDRIDFIVKSLPEILPKADELTQKAKAIQNEVGTIDSQRYPEAIFGKPIREKVAQVIDLVNLGTNFLIRGKPILNEIPYLMGVDEERTYLVLFQNDKELRPTGGFITAYSIAKVNKGKFEPVSSNDIYNLDSTYKPKLAVPDPLVKYLKGPYLISKNFRLRDLNWYPDFSESMDIFGKEIQTVGIKKIDGIIAVDTQVLLNLLEVIGPVGVPGFGNFTAENVAECRCPQVIYELESFADVEGPIVWSENEPGKIVFAPPNYDNRKKIVGPLMNSILANVLGQPKEKIPALFEAAIKSLTEKHVLFYLFDSEKQKAVEEFGIGGNINEYDGDYLHINDSNLGGRKSNLYVKEEVYQDVVVSKDGSVTKELTITYKNPEKHDGWLNSVLPNWVRIYVPSGSELVSFEGVEEKAQAYEEYGKSVFAGFFKLRPEGIAKLTLKYKLPGKIKDEYKLLIQKQPGKGGPLYTLKLGRREEEFILLTDKELKWKI